MKWLLVLGLTFFASMQTFNADLNSKNQIIQTCVIKTKISVSINPPTFWFDQSVEFHQYQNWKKSLLAPIKVKQPSKPEPKNTRVVAITIDDGPQKFFDQRALEILKQYHATATFFFIGQQAAYQTDSIKALAKAGFEIGNHSFTHANFASCSSAKDRSEICQTDRILTGAIGHKPLFFRPPYGAHNSRSDTVAESLGHKVIIWDIDPKDWRGKNGPPPEQTLNYISARLKPGVVILMHEKKNTLIMLPKLLEILKQKNYQTINLSDLKT